MAKESDNPKLLATLIADFSQLFKDLFSGALFRAISQDLHALHDFYIDQERKRRLASMNKIKKWMLIIFWLFKGLILKLSSFRRVLFVVALIMIFTPNQAQGDNNSVLGIFLFVFILLLELKDKLLARQELEAGRAVQKALLPDDRPKVSGWDIWLYSRPANDVGGDLVDFMAINGRRYGLVLGDVAGKGLGAALFMAKLQSTLRALAYNRTSVARLASDMNNIFYRDTISTSFASMLYLELTEQTGKIRYVNCGHLPPYVVSQNKIKTMQKGDRALGLTPDVTYYSQEIDLRTGDFLLIFSDGLSEAANSENEFFNEERIMRIAERWTEEDADEAGKTLLHAVEDFTGNHPQADDLSIIILKKTD